MGKLCQCCVGKQNISHILSSIPSDNVSLLQLRSKCCRCEKKRPTEFTRCWRSSVMRPMKRRFSAGSVGSVQPRKAWCQRFPCSLLGFQAIPQFACRIIGMTWHDRPKRALQKQSWNISRVIAKFYSQPLRGSQPHRSLWRTRLWIWTRVRASCRLSSYLETVCFLDRHFWWSPYRPHLGLTSGYVWYCMMLTQLQPGPSHFSSRMKWRNANEQTPIKTI